MRKDVVDSIIGIMKADSRLVIKYPDTDLIYLSDEGRGQIIFPYFESVGDHQTISSKDYSHPKIWSEDFEHS